MHRLAMAVTLVAILTTPATAEDRPVDVELALLIDGSGSIQPGEFQVEIDGYAGGLESPEVVNAIRSGPIGTIAVMVARFHDPAHYVVVVPWTEVSDGEAASAIASLIRATPYSGGMGTGIGAAVASTIPLFEGNGYEGLSRKIDVVADGKSNAGVAMVLARDAAVLAGVTINGLAIIGDERNLAAWMESEMIGGPGAFVIAIDDLSAFALAMKAKLLVEIAGAEPEERPVITLAQAQGGNCGVRADILAQLAERYGEAPRVMAMDVQGRVVEWTVSASGGWTMLATAPGGSTCIQAAGEYFGKAVRPADVLVGEAM